MNFDLRNDKREDCRNFRQFYVAPQCKHVGEGRGYVNRNKPESSAYLQVRKLGHLVMLHHNRVSRDTGEYRGSNSTGPTRDLPFIHSHFFASCCDPGSRVVVMATKRKQFSVTFPRSRYELHRNAAEESKSQDTLS